MSDEPDMSKLDAPHCHHGEPVTREIRECFCGRAHDAVGDIEPGCQIFGFTKGQFSLMDLLIELVGQIGRCKIDLSTWTAASADLEAAYRFQERGEIERIRFVVDRSFPTRQPEYCRTLTDNFGKDAIRVTRTHAKFAVLWNDEWDLAVRTSMNLNTNPRFEDFDVADDPELAGYLRRVVDEIFERQEVGAAFEGGTTSEDADFRNMQFLGEVSGDSMDTDIGDWDVQL
jgi:hypothetical protein